MHRHVSMFIGLTAGLCSAFSAAAQPLADENAVRYDGYTIVRLDASTPEDLERLERLGLTMVSCELSPDGADFLVPPVIDAASLGFEKLVVDDNVQASLDSEGARIRESLDRLGQRGSGEGFFSDYRPLSEVDAFIDDLIARRPDLVTRFEVGRSHEDRPIWGLRISAGDPGCKPAFIINGITHAREWLTVMNVLFLADHLVDAYGVDAEVTDLVDRVEWLIIPVLNPDGYHYTWTSNRFWRKNRRPPSPEYPEHYGVDPNRNYAERWGQRGSSWFPQSDIYRGPAPFSEPETAAIRDFTLANPQIRAHNDVHSYGQFILFPWAQLTEQCPDHDEFQTLGDEMADRIDDVSGANFSVGPCSTTLYLVSGGSIDWFYAQAGALSFSYELRGPGFDPGPGAIIVAGEEMLPATLLHAAYIADHSSFRADFDEDCVFTYLDVVAFVTAFAEGDLAADFDDDGVLAFPDVLAFIQAFTSMS